MVTRSKLAAYRLLAVMGPLMVPTAMLLARQHVHLGSIAPDSLAGFVAGAGIGLSLVGIVKLQRLSKQP